MNISPAHGESLKQTSKKIRVLSFDTEDNSKGKTLILDFFDGEYHFTFRSVKEAQEFLLLQNKYAERVEVWCANLNYDIGNIFKFDDSAHLKIVTSGSRFISVKSKLFPRIIFRDIFNVMPGQSVKSLGNLVNLEKIDVKGEFDNEYYCQRDAEIVYLSLNKFKSNLGKLNIDLKATAASTAFNYLCSKFPFLRESNIPESVNLFFKSGYCGGRTEVFNTAEHSGSILGYDIISSYPYAMTKVNIPDTGSLTETKELKLEYQGMTEVIIEAPKDLKIPYLPLKGDKLLFPLGTFRGVWTNFELKRALELGYKIKEVIGGYYFALDTGVTFAEFVIPLFNERNDYKKSKGALMAYVLKILLNSCYGKFAQGGDEIELIDQRDLKKFKNISAEILPNGQAIVRKNSGLKNYTNYYLAAIITTIGRDELYKYLRLAESKGTVLYCDTDSVFFKGEPLPKKYIKDGLGGLEKQYEIKKARFISPKVYFVETSDKTYYKCKGVWGDLAKEFFIKGYVEKMSPFKYVETCRKNYFIKNSKNKKLKYKDLLPFNYWDIKTKKKMSNYDKRIVFKNGDTAPIIIN